LVKLKLYIPDRGDMVWLSFNPQSGHEQAGRRPALVLSPRVYNEKTGLAIVCPITSQIKGYPFEASIPENSEIMGVILSDQVKNLDWKARKVEFIGKLPKNALTEVINKLIVLINP
jgi:mRNA interferase MazF